MRYFVTGATGFVGSHLVERLLHEGADVVCAVRDRKALRHLEHVLVRHVTVRDMPFYLAEARPFDYVIHVAGCTRALGYEAYRMANVDWTRHLLDCFTHGAQRHALQRFVFVSSQAAAGPARNRDVPITEEDEPNPVSLYGRSKLEAESVVREYGNLLPVTIVRPSTVFGPRDVDVLGVYRSARWGVVAYIAGPERWVSVVYVENLVSGILAAAHSPAAVGETYFLADPDPVDWRKFSFLIGQVMGRRCRGVPVPLWAMRALGRVGDVIGNVTGNAVLFRSEKVVEMEPQFWVCSSAKAQRDLGWLPEIGREEAIRKTGQWYREQGWL